MVRSGRHFLQLPGPTPVPDAVLEAIRRPVIDHRGPEFQQLTRRVLDGLAWVFRTEGPVFVYPSSATGAWESALTNTLSPGDRVVGFDHGVFATRWARVATRLGLDVRLVPGDWRSAVDPGAVARLLAEDPGHRIKALLIVHNETSTGVTTPLPPIRAALSDAGHPALLMVDAVSSLGAIDLRHDEWGLDVTVSGSQKALMLPPGLSFVAASDRARAAAIEAGCPRSYWSWDEMTSLNEQGFFPYTPATSLLFGLEASLSMIRSEGLPGVFRRHARHARAVRAAVEAWGLEIFAATEDERSNSVTAVLVPEGHDADQLRTVILERYDMSLGKGLGPTAGSVFRIGHLGGLNDLTLVGALAGIEMGLADVRMPHREGGVLAAMAELLQRGDDDS